MIEIDASPLRIQIVCILHCYTDIISCDFTIEFLFDILMWFKFIDICNKMCIRDRYDAELLREAQRNPEQHKDIIVRVWGYSARFVTLCKEMQDHVINRITAVN